MNFGTTYDSPPQMVIDLLTEALSKIPQYDTAEEITIEIEEFNYKGIIYEVTLPIRSQDDYFEARTNTFKIVWYTFREHGLNLYLHHLKVLFAPKKAKEWLKLPSHEQLMEIFHKVPIFKDFTDKDIEFLIDNSKVKEYIPPQRIIEHRELDYSLHVIVRGQVGVLIPKKEGKNLKVSTLKTGNSVGIMSLMTGEPRSAHVVAEKTTVTYEIFRDILKPLVENNPDYIDDIAARIEEIEQENIQKEKRYKKSKKIERAMRQKRRETLVGKIREFFGIV